MFVLRCFVINFITACFVYVPVLYISLFAGLFFGDILNNNTNLGTVNFDNRAVLLYCLFPNLWLLVMHIYWRTLETQLQIVFLVDKIKYNALQRKYRLTHF